jgi:intracellular septation protein
MRLQRLIKCPCTPGAQGVSNFSMIRVLVCGSGTISDEGIMQPFYDLLPVIAFFAAYWIADFQTAIVVIMIAMTIQIIATRLITGTVSKILLFSGALVVGLGGISLLLQNELIFKWKPTVLNWIFALAFLGSRFIGDKPIIQRVLESAAVEGIRLCAADWQKLNLMWVVFFIIAGIANIFVAYTFSEAVWVNFKLFGLLGITFLFIVFQAAWLARRTQDGNANANNGN